MAPGSPLLGRLVEEFGPRILRADGSLDRSRLAGLIFSNPEARRRLNTICHPLILAVVARRLEELRASDSPPAVVVVVAPLLFEAGAEKTVDKTIVVTASEEARLRRLKERDGLSEEEIRARFAAQMPPREQCARADWVIDNSGDLAETERKVEALWIELISPS